MVSGHLGSLLVDPEECDFERAKLPPSTVESTLAAASLEQIIELLTRYLSFLLLGLAMNVGYTFSELLIICIDEFLACVAL